MDRGVRMTTAVTLSTQQLERIARMEKRVAPLRMWLESHKLHEALGGDVDDLRKFAEIHVWCVWVMMSMLKAFQVELATKETLPWIPSSDGRKKEKLARMVNEMALRYQYWVVDEKTGKTTTNFEMYLCHWLVSSTLASQWPQYRVNSARFDLVKRASSPGSM